MSVLEKLPDYQQRILSFYENWYLENPTQIMKYRLFETGPLISILEIHKGKLVVDIGFGNIPFLIELDKKGFKARGENFCQAAIDQAKVMAPHIDLIRCAMPKILAKGANAIVARHCLYHLSPDDIAALAQSLEQSLVSGGHFLFMHDLDPMVDPNPNINFFHSAAEIADKVSANSCLKIKFKQQVQETVYLEGKVIGASPVWLCCLEKE